MQPSREPSFNRFDRVVPLRPEHKSVPLSQAHHARRIRIGRILLEANLLSSESLNEALSIAKDLEQPIGKVLTSTEQVKDRDLQSALLAQAMIQEGVVEERMAIEALKHSVTTGATFGEALDQVMEVIKARKDNDLLEELLLAANMVSPTVLDECRLQSARTGVPIGRCLMQVHGVVFAHLNYAFECLGLIASGKIDKANAIWALKAVKAEKISLSLAFKKNNVSPKNTQSKLKLGDLLTAGSVLSEKDTLACVEQALNEKRLIGEILVQSGLVSSDLLQEALTMQNFVVKDVISKEVAANVLRLAVTTKKDILIVVREQATFEDNAETSACALDLLLRARLVEHEMVPQAMHKQIRYGMHALKALVATDFVTANVCRAAIECARMVDSGEMTQQEAVLILHHCDRSRCEFSEAVKELGFEFASGRCEPNQVDTKQITGRHAAAARKVTKQVGEDDEQTLRIPDVLPQWNTSPELKLAVLAFLVGVSSAGTALSINPGWLVSCGLCLIVFCVGVAFFVLGRCWETRVEERRLELKKQREQAKQQVSRLSKRRKNTY